MIESARPSPHKITCDEAWLYCATLEHDSKYDWRMPTYYERINLEAYGAWDIHDFNFIGSETTHIYRIIPVRDKND